MCACHMRRRIHVGLCECISGIAWVCPMRRRINVRVSYEEEDTYGIV